MWVVFITAYLIVKTSANTSSTTAYTRCVRSTRKVVKYRGTLTMIFFSHLKVSDKDKRSTKINNGLVTWLSSALSFPHYCIRSMLKGTLVFRKL